MPYDVSTVHLKAEQQWSRIYSMADDLFWFRMWV